MLGNRSATVSWDAPAGSSVYQYRVTIDPGGQFVDTQGQQAVFQDLDNRTSYSFKILPTNAQGDGPAGFSGTVPSLKARADAYMVGNLDDFLAIKSLQPAPFEWSDDGCSTPNFVEPGPFLEPCKRHDFGYRNYGAGGLELGGTFPQNLVNWQWVNVIFLRDMRDTCRHALDLYCWNAARLGWAGVSSVGGFAYYNGD